MDLPRWDTEERKAIHIAPRVDYETGKVPSGFDRSINHKIYISGVANPVAFFLNLVEDDIEDLRHIEMANEIQKFYEGSWSKLYLMREEDIKPYAPCVALFREEQK